MSLPHPSTTAVTVPVLAAWAIHALVLRRRLELARRDPLTGLPTRAGWNQQAQRMLRGDGQIAVLLLDLDGFKDVNDTHGHAAGDELLAEVAERLTRWCTPGGVAGRLGGDEFVIALRVDSERAGVRLLERVLQLHAAIGGPVRTRAGRLHPSASIGLAHTGDHPRDLSRLLERADAAMYVAKAAGTGVHLADEHLPQVRAVNGRRQGRPGTGTPSPMEAAA